MRTFIALTPNPQSLKTLQGVQSSLGLPQEDILTPEEKLHLTLIFCGDIPEERVTDMITMMLNGPSHTALTLQANHFSFFGYEHTKRLVLCFKKNKELENLYAHCLDELRELQVPCEIDKEYKPHITLANIKSNIALPQLHDDVTLRFLRLTVFESKLSPEGSTYHQLAGLELR